MSIARCLGAPLTQASGFFRCLSGAWPGVVECVGEAIWVQPRPLQTLKVLYTVL